MRSSIAVAFAGTLCLALGPIAVAGHLVAVEGPPGFAQPVTNVPGGSGFQNLYQATLSVTRAEPIDAVFTARTAGDLTQYELFIDFRNELEDAVVGLIIELGFGTGASFASVTLPGLAFLSAGAWTDFAGVAPSEHTDTRLVWGPVADIHIEAGDARYLLYTLAIPDPDPAHVPPAFLITTPDAPDEYRFTLRHTAIVIPEPGTLLLVTLAPLLLCRRARR